jgi:hypothetical protein
VHQGRGVHYSVTCDKMSLAQNHVYIRATGTVQKAEFEHSLDATKLEGNLDDWLAEKRSTIQSHGDLSSRLRRNVPATSTVTKVPIFGRK